jgi:hypothetical protein
MVTMMCVNLYDSSGVGIPERQYYYIDDSGNVVHKLKSLPGSIFHEFSHGVHEIEGVVSKKNSEISLDILMIKLTIQYCPRIGHCGYNSGEPDEDADNITELQKSIPFYKKIVERWKKYLIA